MEDFSALTAGERALLEALNGHHVRFLLRKTSRKPLRVMDPMAGSGTTLVVAKALGHEPIDFDRDPLAVLLSKVWCSNLAEAPTRRIAQAVLDVATRAIEASLERGPDLVGSDWAE